jgi:hypothetical protein
MERNKLVNCHGFMNWFRILLLTITSHSKLMEKTLLKKIKAGQMVYGTCIASTAPTWPAIAKRAGLDFVFFDTEHIPL